VDFKRWQKKMHFLFSSMSVVYVLTTPMPEERGDNPTVEQVKKKAKWDNDYYVCRGLILNDFKRTLKHLKEELTLIELGSHMRIEESLRAHDNNKPKGNNVDGPSVVNMVEHNNSSRYNDNRGKRKHHDTKADPNKKPKVTCWKCEKPKHLKIDYKASNVGNKSNGSGTKGSVDGFSNPLKEGRYTNNIGSAFVTTSELNDSILWHARLGHVDFKRMQDMSKYGDLCDLHATPSLGNKKYFVRFIDDASRFCYVYLLHSKDEALDNFKVFNTEVELQQGFMIKRFMIDKGDEYMDTLYFQSVGIIHETNAPYTPQKNGISERKNRAPKEMVNSMLSYLGPSQGFWGEAMLTVFYLLNRVPNKRNMITLYELWTKKKPNLNYLRVWGCKAVVRLLDPKLKTLGERGIECIFVRYAEHFKAF
nr:zinc finger, CCHC-type [Tanacetum cinerariifolium]